jgi:hypothetical protein
MEAGFGSRLRDGSFVPNHDDWCCIQDMCEAGFFTVVEIEPGVVLQFTEIGKLMAAKLREHKRDGGNFAEFGNKLGLQVVVE